MERFILVVVLCFTWTDQAFSDSHDKWDYVIGGAHGPKKWGGVCQTGTKQTPIDIKRADTTWKKDFGNFTLKNYDIKPPNVTFNASNNGHTFQISFPGNIYNVSGGDLVGVFTTVQFHLHWGSTNMKGSEHFLNGNKYAAELHFVSYNTKYASLGDAATKSDGLAVLGVFLTVEGNDNPDYAFLDETKNVINKKTTKGGIPPFKFDRMLPADLKKFVRYSGSLTTPGCFESVTWTVFADAVKISQSQVDLLRKLKDSNDEFMVDNFRPIQALNNRKVYASFNVSEFPPAPPMTTTTPSSKGPTADATAVSMSTAALFLLMLVAAIFMH